MQDLAVRTIDECYRSFLGDDAVDGFVGSSASDREVAAHIGNADVLLRGGVIVGFVVYFRDLIHLVMIDIRHHRTGLGTRLLAHAEKMLFGRGNVLIRLETFEGNEQAIRFYGKHGWTESGTRAGEAPAVGRLLFEKSRAHE